LNTGSHKKYLLLIVMLSGCTTMKAFQSAGNEFSQGNVGSGVYESVVGVPISMIYDVFTLGGTLSTSSSTGSNSANSNVAFGSGPGSGGDDGGGASMLLAKAADPSDVGARGSNLTTVKYNANDCVSLVSHHKGEMSVTNRCTYNINVFACEIYNPPRGYANGQCKSNTMTNLTFDHVGPGDSHGGVGYNTFLWSGGKIRVFACKDEVAKNGFIITPHVMKWQGDEFLAVCAAG
jgi:hypothetical protein